MSIWFLCNRDNTKTAVSPRSSPLGDVSRGGTSATQRQKFHTDEVNQCLLNKSRSHGVPNANLFNFTFLLVDLRLSVVFICERAPLKLKCFF